MKLREMVGAMVVYLLIAARQITAQSCEGTKAFFNDCESKLQHIYNGTEYGTTKNGRNCQNWSTQTNYPEYAYVGNHNFCRNPSDHSSSWCVSTDSSKNYEDCDVPICDSSLEIRKNNERLAACKKNPKCEGCQDLLRKWEHTNCESTKFLIKGYPDTPMIDLDAKSLGEWGPLEQCKYPHFVHKMELKIQPEQGCPADDTALNAIRLICSDGQTISSTQERWGDWKGVKECDVGSFINAAKIRRESSQGGGDDTGGNGIRFKCTDGNQHYPGDGYWGDWSSYQSCKPGSAVYGIQTRVARAGRDNTALNDVRFLCAKLPLEEEDICATEEGACIFPFTYDGHTYNGCTNASHDKAWCATKEDQTGSWWGNCPSTCQMHLSDNTVYTACVKNPKCEGCEHTINKLNSSICELTTHSTGLADVEYSEPIKGCLWRYNEKNHHGKNLEECKEKCRLETFFDCKSLEYRERGNLCYLSKETKDTQPNSFYEPCTGEYADMDYIEMKRDEDVLQDVLLRNRKDGYTNCVTKLRCDGCYNIIKTFLPELIRANLITEGEIGVHDGVSTPYKNWAPTLGMLKEGNILTRRVFDESVTINGTINGYIGKRNYGDDWMRYRPTGLYAAPGDMVTITFPEELSGKVGVDIGIEYLQVYFPPMNTSVFKIGSPWGGHIILFLTKKYAIKGEFTIKVENAIKAPFFVLGKTTNEEWNSEIRHYSPKWAVFRIPGQANIFIQTLRIKDITDMEGALNRIKKTMDVAEDMIGLPPGSQPGAEWIVFSAHIRGVLGVHYGGYCHPGASHLRDWTYSNNYEYTNVLWETHFSFWNEEGNGTEDTILHEMGHGYCHNKGHEHEYLPNIGAQWTAETTRRYVEYVRGDRSYEDFMTNPDLDFYLFYRMVAFSLHSNGRPCGEAKFNSRQLYEGYNDRCWKWLNWIPERLHGWHIWRDVLTLDAKSTKNYTSKTDRMVDLYCQATKYNMLPLFNLYNIQPEDQTITSNCENLPESDLMTKWLNVVICVKESMTNGNPDVRDCAKMPHFPKHKGVCLLNGVCQNDETYGGVPTNMENRFDLYGNRFNDYEKDTANNEEKCLKRSSDYFKDCENDYSQYITATFITKDGNSKSRRMPPLGRATMSSIYSESYSAEKCMDYNLDTYCHNKNEDEENPFFMIEYPAPVKVKEVRLTTTDETDYWDNAREIVVIVTNDTIPEPLEVKYSEPIKGCVWWHNMKNHHGKNLEECKEKCRLETSCNSLEYRERGNKCFLSKETKDTQPRYFFEPCVFYYEVDYADMVYIEKTVIAQTPILPTGVQIGPTFEGPATKGGEEINFRSETGVIGKYVIVQQQYKGIMTFAEVQVNPETGGIEDSF